MAGIDRERWRRVSPLLDELLDADAARRAERLAEIRGEDAPLADEVAALLAREAAVDALQFLEGSVLAGATLAGRTIGSYTLERPLGHGGMGSVWLARRSDGCFEGKAAVKFLNLALLGDADAAHAMIARWVADAQVEAEVATQCQMYRAQLAQTHNDAAAALRHALQAQRLLRAAPRPAPVLQASLHGELGFGYAMKNRLEDADREYAAALRAHRELGRADSAGAVAILNNWALVSWAAGDTKRALELIDETIALAGRRGATGIVPPYAAANRAAALLALGRHAEALAAAERAIAIAEQAGHLGFKTTRCS